MTAHPSSIPRSDAPLVNLASALETVADQMHDAPAVIHGSRVLTWAELDDQAARIATALAARGVGPGDRVAIGLFNSGEYVVSLLGVLKLRATPINLNYRYKESELHHVLGDSESRAAIFDVAIADRVLGAAAAIGGFRALLQLGGVAADGVDDFAVAVASSAPMDRIERDDDEWMLYTGGTTGLPKGVKARHSWVYQICVQSSFRLLGEPTPETYGDLAALTSARRGGAEQLVCMPLSPLMHGVGVYNTLATLQGGGTVVFVDATSFDARATIDMVEAHGVTDIAMVGDAFSRPLVDELERRERAGQPARLDTLRRVRSSGATWTSVTKRSLLRHGRFTCQDMIVASEGGPFAISVDGPDPDSVPETARFRLTPNARLLDDQNRDVVPGSGVVGRLAALTDDHIHYVGDPEKTAATFHVVDGRRYVIPGDLATLEADGTLVFKGRGSSVINTGGEKVHAGEVEDALLDHPSIREAVVVGVPDERWGNRVAAVIALQPGARLSEQEASDWVAERLANYKRPRDVVIVDRLERSPAGKADLQWARDLASSSVVSR